MYKYKYKYKYGSMNSSGLDSLRDLNLRRFNIDIMEGNIVTVTNDTSEIVLVAFKTKSYTTSAQRVSQGGAVSIPNLSSDPVQLIGIVTTLNPKKQCYCRYVIDGKSGLYNVSTISAKGVCQPIAPNNKCPA
jgi:hypothetical protein